MLREGLKHVLSSTRFKLHPESLTGSEIALDREALDTPLLFILDAHLFSPRLTHGISSLKEQYSQARIVVLSDSFDLDDMRLVFQSGADGYCLATTGCEALIKYLDLVMLGEMVFPSAALLDAIAGDRQDAGDWKEEPAVITPSTHASPLFDIKDSPIRTLSSREAEILQCLMHGAPNKVIARKLDVAEATVKVHIKAILRKIRVANRTQAAMWAVNHFSAGDSDGSQLTSGERPDAHHLR
jgi:two-component system nitrate/nitrite response regulator NarL